ncbi:uncharacterized protein LOC141604816 [Silene latifolia]|uniref:uncharacterized protein LOC141604816 n=1 Tax=Silene latifolia TaxID=37657 RepID=UPI003D770722
MKRKALANGESHAEENGTNGALANPSNAEVGPGDVIWVKHQGGSWWPAQIVDEKAVSNRNKPRRKRSEDVLVRLYGSYEYLFVDPVANLVEFDKVLKRHKGSHKEIIQEALRQGFKTKARSAKAKGNGEKDVDDDTQVSNGNDVTPQKPGESARRLKVMQGLGLIAPSGSPFLKNGHSLTLVQ